MYESLFLSMYKGLLSAIPAAYSGGYISACVFILLLSSNGIHGLFNLENKKHGKYYDANVAPARCDGDYRLEPGGDLCQVQPERQGAVRPGFPAKGAAIRQYGSLAFRPAANVAR